MRLQLNRREAVQRAALAGAGVWIGTRSRPAFGASPGEKLNLAFIGVGGRGRANLDALATQNVVALCDVDQKRAGNAFDKYPRAKRFVDFRRMLDDMDKQIDAVVVSTPDHTHFHPAMMAMQMGKHLYCEKPMAHCVAEVRAMTDLAAQKNLATQLGVQRHTLDNVHRVVELIQAGTIGSVTECHAWVGGDRGMPPAPTEFPAVPKHLNWDLWLGPAEFRPYSPAYAPYNWRFWWDFGTGEMGNWGCHILDVPFWALGLKHPTRVDASGPERHDETTPKSMTTRFEFPARANQSAVTLHWHHTKTGPEILKRHKMPHFKSGVLFVGSEGMLLCDFSKRKLYPEEKFTSIQGPDQSIPDSPGFHQEWIDACKGGQAATCEFGYSGPLTETVLLGNVAYRAGGGFEWNAKSLTAQGNDTADLYIRDQYRAGWEFNL